MLKSLPNTQDESLHGWVEEIARRQPDTIAVQMGECSLTYAELNLRANRLAFWLRDQNIGVGDCVGICLHRSLEMAIAVLAVLKSNAAYVPLDPEYPIDRLKTIRDDASLHALLTESKLASLFASESMTTLCLDTGIELLRDYPASNLADYGDGKTPTYLLYTSGSTGKPKGVEMPRRALLNLVRWVADTAQVPENARTLQFPSLAFDVSFEDIFSTWCMGGTLFLLSEEARRDPKRLWELLVSHQIHRIYLPAVALQQLAETYRPEVHGSNSLRWIVTSGEQLVITSAVRELFKRLPGCTLQNEYGPTEAHVVTALPLTGNPDDWAARPNIGKPIPNVTTEIRNDVGNLVTNGETGELFIGGVCVANGYLGQPERTAERFQERNGLRFYRTGDLARWLPDGNIEFLGRADTQVKIRGYRVELGEIETLLLSHSDILEATVQVWEALETDRRLAAYLVPKNKNLLDISALKTWVGAKLPDYMIPAAFLCLDALPLTVNGKIDLKRLPKPEIVTAERTNFVPPKNSLEQQIAAMWQDLLRVEQVGTQDNFFDLGGHSLLVAQLQERLQTELGKEIAVTDIFRFPTVAALAAFLSEETDNSARSSTIHDRAARQKEAQLRQRQLAGTRGRTS